MLASPYDHLYIYLIKGLVPRGEEASLGRSFLGNWVEEDTCFLFFSGPSSSLVSEVLSRHPRLQLLENYHFSYEEWQGFRIKDREPELWDPTSGKCRAAVYYRSTPGGRTVVPINLPKRGSVFVVFRKPAAVSHPVSASPSAERFEIDEGGGVRVWEAGQYALKTTGAKEIALTVKDLPASIRLEGPWTVRFAPGWGAPESAVTD